MKQMAMLKMSMLFNFCTFNGTLSYVILRVGLVSHVLYDVVGEMLGYINWQNFQMTAAMPLVKMFLSVS